MHIVYRHKLPIAHRTPALELEAVHSPPVVAHRRPALKEILGWVIRLPLGAVGGLSTPHLTVPHRPTGSPNDWIGGLRSPVRCAGNNLGLLDPKLKKRRLLLPVRDAPVFTSR